MENYWYISSFLPLFFFCPIVLLDPELTSMLSWYNNIPFKWFVFPHLHQSVSILHTFHSGINDINKTYLEKKKKRRKKEKKRKKEKRKKKESETTKRSLVWCMMMFCPSLPWTRLILDTIKHQIHVIFPFHSPLKSKRYNYVQIVCDFSDGQVPLYAIIYFEAQLNCICIQHLSRVLMSQWNDTASSKILSH